MKVNNELEIYSCIKGYHDYLVTSYGRVLSLKGKKIKEIKYQINHIGYYRVFLYKNNKRKPFMVHRLVAQAFISNPDNKPQVNHIDENKQNNHVSNLEWVTNKENVNYGTRNKKASKSLIKTLSDGRLKGINNPNCKGSIVGINEKTGDVRLYKYMNECKKDNFNVSCVSNCLNGRHKTHKGYTWNYIEESE